LIDTLNKQEVLPPLSQEPSGARGWFDWLTDGSTKQFMLPATGLLIMGLDWLCFSEEAVTLGLGTVVSAPIGFLLGSLGACHLQRKYAKDSTGTAGLKALIAGVLVGIPFPLAGTIAGAWIVANSGLAAISSKLLKDRLFRRS
jgi:hypothetical protein